MKESTPTHSIEPRWPIVLAIVAVILMLEGLPTRIRIFPYGINYFIGASVIMPMIAVSLSSAKVRWLKVERSVTLLFFLVTVVGIVTSQAKLVGEMIHRSGEVSGLQLLTSSVAMWVVNVLAFSLLFWQLDRGGPVALAKGESPRPEWLLPQDGVPAENLPPGWRPVFVDYLFLGFCTATAFSPTDVLPLTPRAKMLMMLESSISLVTIVVVASRAINILGS